MLYGARLARATERKQYKVNLTRRQGIISYVVCDFGLNRGRRGRLLCEKKEYKSDYNMQK